MTSTHIQSAISKFLPTTHLVDASSVLAQEVYIDELTGDIVVLARVSPIYCTPQSPTAMQSSGPVVYHEAQFYCAATVPAYTQTTSDVTTSPGPSEQSNGSHNTSNDVDCLHNDNNNTDRPQTAALQHPITVCRVKPPKKQSLPLSSSNDVNCHDGPQTCQMITTARRFPRPMMVRARSTGNMTTKRSPSNTSSNVSVHEGVAKCSNSEEYTTSYMVAIAHDDRQIEFYISLPSGTSSDNYILSSTPLMSVFIGSYKCYPNTLRFRRDSYSILYFQWTTNHVESSMGFGTANTGERGIGNGKGKDSNKQEQCLGSTSGHNQQDFVSDAVTDIWTSPNRSFYYRSKILLGGGGIPVPSPSEVLGGGDSALFRKFLFPPAATKNTSPFSDMFASTGDEISKASTVHVESLKAAATRANCESNTADRNMNYSGSIYNSENSTTMQSFSPRPHSKSGSSASFRTVFNYPHGASVTSSVAALDTFLGLRDQLMIIYTEISVDLVYIDFKPNRQRSNKRDMRTVEGQSSQSPNDAAIQEYNDFLSNHIYPQQGGSGSATGADDGKDGSADVSTSGMVTLLRRVPTRINFWSTLAPLHVGVVVNRAKPNNVKPIAELGGYIWIMPQFSISGLAPVVIPAPVKSTISRSSSFFSGMQVPCDKNKSDISHPSPTANNTTLYYPLQVLLLYDELYIAFINYRRGCIVLYRYNHHNKTGKAIDMASAMMATVPRLDTNSNAASGNNNSFIENSLHSSMTSPTSPMHQRWEQRRQTLSNKAYVNTTHPKNAYQCVRYYSSSSAQLRDAYPSSLLQSISDATDLSSDDKDAAVASSIEALMVDHETLYTAPPSAAEYMTTVPTPEQPLSPFAANGYKTNYINNASDIGLLISEGQPIPPKGLLYRSIAAADFKMSATTTRSDGESHQKADGVCEHPQTPYSSKLNDDIAETRAFFIASHDQESSYWRGDSMNAGSSNSVSSTAFIHPAITFTHLTSLVSTAVATIGKGTVYYNRSYPFFSANSDVHDSMGSQGHWSRSGTQPFNTSRPEPCGNTQHIRDSDGYGPMDYAQEAAGENGSQQSPAAFEVAFVLPLPATSIISAIRAEYYFGYDILVARHWWERECEEGAHQVAQRLLDAGGPVYPPYLVMLQYTTDNILVAHIPHTVPDEAVAFLDSKNMKNCDDAGCAVADVYHQPCHIAASYDIKLTSHGSQVSTANLPTSGFPRSSNSHQHTAYNSSGLSTDDSSLIIHVDGKYSSATREQQIATARVVNARKLIGESCRNLPPESSELVRRGPVSFNNTALQPNKGFITDPAYSLPSCSISADQSGTEAHQSKAADAVQSSNAEAASILASFASYYSLHKITKLVDPPPSVELDLLQCKAQWISAIMMNRILEISIQHSAAAEIVALSSSKSNNSFREFSEPHAQPLGNSSSLTSSTGRNSVQQNSTGDSTTYTTHSIIMYLASLQNTIRIFCDGVYITDLMHEMARMIMSPSEGHASSDAKEQPMKPSKKRNHSSSPSKSMPYSAAARDESNLLSPIRNARYGFDVYTIEALQAAEKSRSHDREQELSDRGENLNNRANGEWVDVSSEMTLHETSQTHKHTSYLKGLAIFKNLLGRDSKNDSNNEDLHSGISPEPTAIHTTVPLIHHLPLSVCSTSSHTGLKGNTVYESVPYGTHKFSHQSSFTVEPCTVICENRITIGGPLPSCLAVAKKVIIPGQTQTSVSIPTSHFSEGKKKTGKEEKEKGPQVLTVSNPPSTCHCQQYVIYINHINMARNFSSDHEALWCYGRERKDKNRKENEVNTVSSTGIETSYSYTYYHTPTKSNPRSCLPVGMYDNLLITTAQYFFNRGAVLKGDLPMCFGAVTGNMQELVSSVEIITSFLLFSVTHQEPLATTSRLFDCAIAHHCNNKHHAAWFDFWYDRWKGIYPFDSSSSPSQKMNDTCGTYVSIFLDVIAPSTHTSHVSGSAAASIGEIIRYTNAVKQPHMYPLLSSSAALSTYLHKLSSSSSILCDMSRAPHDNGDNNTPKSLRRVIQLQLVRPTADGPFLFREILEAPIGEIFADIAVIQSHAEEVSQDRTSVISNIEERCRLRHNYILYTLFEFCRVLVQRGIPVSAPIQLALMRLLLNGTVVLDEIPVGVPVSSKGTFYRRVFSTTAAPATDVGAMGTSPTTDNSNSCIGDHDFSLCTGGASPEAYYRLHQLLMYRAFEDHIPTALQLIALQPYYPQGFQVGLDILMRLRAHRHIIHILLQHKKTLQAAKYYFSIKKDQMSYVLSQQQILYRKHVIVAQKMNSSEVRTAAAASNFLKDAHLLQVYPSSNDIDIVVSLLQAAADEHEEELELVHSAVKRNTHINRGDEYKDNTVTQMQEENKNLKSKGQQSYRDHECKEEQTREEKLNKIVNYLRSRRDKKCAKHFANGKGTGWLFYCVYNLLVCQYLEVAVLRSIKITSAAASLASLGVDNHNVNSSFSDDYVGVSSSGKSSITPSGTSILSHFPVLRPFWDRYNSIASMVQ